MNIKIKNVDKSQILKYLGHRGNSLDQEFSNELEDSIEEIKRISDPKWIMREFNLKELSLEGTNLTFEGESIKELLKTSKSVVLFATTLGSKVDLLISRYSKSNLSKAVIFDSVASAAVESICEEIEYSIKIEKSEKGLFLTDRFSPGYGDLKIQYSKDICRVLDTGRKIGLTTSQTGIMIPRKSVTAIIGVSNIKQSYRERGCTNCMMSGHCEFRKRGSVCYAK